LTSSINKRLVALGLILFAVFLFLGLIVFSHSLQLLDESLFLQLSSPHVPLDGVMVYVSTYGQWAFWGLLVVLLWVFGRKGEKRMAFILVVTFIVAFLAGELLKSVQFRPRPYDVLTGVRLLVTPSVNSSFPSGHALIVSAGAVASWLIVKGKRYAAPMIVEAALVCYSRIYVGVHFPLDVLAGCILGGCVACLIVGISGALTPVFTTILRIWVQSTKKLKYGYALLNRDSEE